MLAPDVKLRSFSCDKFCGSAMMTVSRCFFSSTGSAQQRSATACEIALSAAAVGWTAAQSRYGTCVSSSSAELKSFLVTSSRSSSSSPSRTNLRG